MTGPLLLALLTASAAGETAAIAQERPPAELRSLHLRQTVWGGDDFVIVEPVGPDVRVRVIRIARANEHCPSLQVEAAETMVSGTTVQAVAHAAVCSMTQGRVDRAHARAPHVETIDARGGIEAVVAECGRGDRELVSRTPPFPDRDALERQAPDVAAVWNILPRLRTLVLDSSGAATFEGATAEVMAQRVALGTTLVPAMLSGKYGEYLRPTLATYSGPPAGRHPTFVELVDADTLALQAYTAPVMPQIAISARVFGDVRLRLAVEPTDGSVTNVDVVNGPALLHAAAASAAKNWRFAAGGGTARVVETTVRFRLRCG